MFHDEIQLCSDKALGKAINRLRFKTHIYDNEHCDYMRIFQMVNDVRKLSGFRPMSRELFDEGYQYFNIFADKYEHALEEFRRLCAGDW